MNIKTLSLLIIVGTLSACACARTEDVVADQRSAPQSLDEALAHAGLERVSMKVLSREQTSTPELEPVVRGNSITIGTTAGWKATPPVFARSKDGALILTVPREVVTEVKHVEAGCLSFAGGRGWFETVTYEIPDGLHWAGTREVSYEVVRVEERFSTTDANGQPCPSPALD